jgi:hypothetical protein
MNNPAPVYRIIRHRDRREGVWFDVETIAADGSRGHVLTVDTRDEARDIVRRLEADANARRGGWQTQLDADFAFIRAAHAAARLQRLRRLVIAAEGLGSWLAVNRDGLAADRRRAAAELSDARRHATPAR